MTKNSLRICLQTSDYLKDNVLRVSWVKVIDVKCVYTEFIHNTTIPSLRESTVQNVKLLSRSDLSKLLNRKEKLLGKRCIQRLNTAF